MFGLEPGSFDERSYLSDQLLTTMTRAGFSSNDIRQLNDLIQDASDRRTPLKITVQALKSPAHVFSSNPIPPSHSSALEQSRALAASQDAARAFWQSLEGKDRLDDSPNEPPPLFPIYTLITANPLAGEDEGSSE
jgi:hypothetical protein